MKEFNTDAVKMLNRITAKEIDQKMRKLRMNASENDKRRWVWELIQNAKDKAAVDFSSKKVSIQLLIQDNVLEFSHNFGYFNKANITGLIRQISSDEKDRDDVEKLEPPKTTGRFGTGFMTTHLLSFIVDVSGIYRKDEASFYNVNFPLNRSYRKTSELEIYIDEAFLIAEDSLEELDRDNIDFALNNSKFRYRIENEASRNVLKQGINDLKKSLLYSLIFVNSIYEVKIIDGENEIIFKSGESKVVSTGICSINIEIKENGNVSEETFIYLKKNLTTIVVKVEEQNGNFQILPFVANTPKLFLDFPLIGTENFGLPFIVNNPFFEPTEPRDGIFLTNEDEREVIENKQILNDAIGLYFTLLDYASSNHWKDIYLLAAISQYSDLDWLSTTWYNELSSKIYEKLSKTALINIAGGERVSLKEVEVLFPSHRRKEVREKIWDLTNKLFPSFLPLKEDIHKWYSIIGSWKDCFKYTLLRITKDIHEFKNLTALTKYFDTDKNKAIDWLNEYYDLLNFEGEVIKHIIQNEYAVVPAQDGNFYMVSDLCLDLNIEEYLKDIIKILGEDWRKRLRIKSLQTHNKYDKNSKIRIKHNSIEQISIINRINTLLISNEISSEQKNQAIYLLSSCFPSEYNEKRNTIYNFTKSIFKNEILEKNILQNYEETIWVKSDELILQTITEQISKNGNINTLREVVDVSEYGSICDWLEKYISFLIKEGKDNLLNDKTIPLLPDQNGDFRIKDELNLDDGDIDELLKDISKDFGYDFREELLMKEIYLEMPETRVKSNKDIAIKIEELIKEKLNSEKDKETKNVFNRLYIWLNNNKELAESIFKSLYQRRHRLRNDEDIIEDMHKAKELDRLMRKFKVSNINDLENLVSTGLSIKTDEHKESISLDTLISLGITTIEELNKVMAENTDLASRFNHISVSSSQWFITAQKKIARAKRNVKEYLSSLKLENYNCEDWEELSTTVIGGISKDGKDISIVVRPSDNGEIIFYSGAEKDTLDSTETELWVENGISKPELITLGRILKDNSINKVALK